MHEVVPTQTTPGLDRSGACPFSAPDELRTLARLDTPGTCELELRASDSVLETAQRLVVHVTAGGGE